MINGISGISLYTRSPYYSVGAVQRAGGAQRTAPVEKTAPVQAPTPAQYADAAQKTGGAQKAGGVWTAQRTPSPETPVQPVTPVKALNGGEQSTAKLGLPVQLGADPAEMAVRMRIQYVDPEDLKPQQVMNQEEEVPPEEQLGAEGAQAALEEGECQTCKERKYQDESDDMGVSYQTPTNIAPDQAASAVRGHEMEHVYREQAKAEREDRKVISQSVTIHTAICPECGKAYVSGGTTRTTTAAKQDTVQAAQQAQQEQSRRTPFSAVA
ncbi:MAG: hypothetical protein HFF90_12440 [Oscillibacter sp.]|nr:hypothetical protein [Oscillibacter sp.]